MEDKYFACCIKYSTGETFLIIGLCVGIGGPLLLLTAITVSVVITRRRRRHKKSRRSTTDPLDEQPHLRPLPLHPMSTDYFDDDYNNHISGYNNDIDASGSTNYSQSISRTDAASMYTHQIDASEDEPSSLTNISRDPKAKPFGYFVRPGKRISWTRPIKEEGMQQHDLARDLALKVTPHLETRQDTWNTGYDRYTGEPTSDSIEVSGQSSSQGPFWGNTVSVDNSNGYSRTIDEENDKSGQHSYGDVFRRQPERSENPANDGTKIRRGNVKSYYPPVRD